MKTIMDKHTIINLKLRGYSNRKAARELGINRKTVAKYWNEYKEANKELEEAKDKKEVQEKIIENPEYKTTNRKKRKYTKEIDELLDQILASEKEKDELLGNHKQSLTSKRIHKMIVGKGFDIGLTTISNQIRIKRAKIRECFIKQKYDLGDRLEYDFGEIKILILGKAHKIYAAVLSSPAAGSIWAYLYTNTKKDVFLDSQTRYFEMMKGCHKEVVYDNMKNVVTRFIGRNEKQLNEDLIKLSIYYGFDINVTNCFRGNEKGHVESSVKKLQRSIFSKKYKFNSLEEARSYLHKELVELNKDSQMEEEKNHLLPYKPMLEIADIFTAKINKYGFARVETNSYSVPDYLVGKIVTVKKYYDYIYFYANNHFVCKHKRIDGSNEVSIDIRHYLNTFEKKPGAIRNSLVLKKTPQLKAIYDIYFSTKSKEFVALMKKYQHLTMHDLIDVLKRERNGKIPSSSKIIDITQKQLEKYNYLSVKEKH